MKSIELKRQKTKNEKESAENQAAALCDAHAHIGSRRELLLRRKQGIRSLICAVNPKEAAQLEELSARPELSPVVIPSFGLHPWQSGEHSFCEMEPWLLKAPVIGEIGMDSVWCSVPLAVQERAFCAQLELASALKKPVVLHTKGQEKRIAGLIARYENTYLVHWYSGTEGLEEFIALGCYFSIGPDVFFNPSTRRAALLAPKNRLLTETDGCGAVKWAFENFLGAPGWTEEAKREKAKRLPGWRDIEGVLKNTLFETAALRLEKNASPFFFPETLADASGSQTECEDAAAEKDGSKSGFLQREARRLAAQAEENFFRFLASS